MRPLTQQRAEPSSNQITAVPGLAVAEPHHAVAQRFQLGVPGSIRFECRARAMRLPTVGLDDKPAITPQEVDLVRTDPDIDLRLGEPMAPEPEETPLELRSRGLLEEARNIADRQVQNLGLSDGSF